MARYNELPVFKDMYTLTLLLFEYTQDFSREYKYTIGQDIKRDALQLIRSIYRANKANAKREHLERFMDEFELLQLEIRSVSSKALPSQAVCSSQALPVIQTIPHPTGARMRRW
jgi:hypothetical protein